VFFVSTSSATPTTMNSAPRGEMMRNGALQ